MWTKAMVRDFQRGLALAKSKEAPIAKLLQLGKLSPSLAERAQQLEDMRDYLERATRVALAVDGDGEDGE